MEILPEPAFLAQAIGGRLPQVGDRRTRTNLAIYDVAATDGDAVVGSVEFGERRNPYALYWEIGTDRCILLHPPQATSSRAYAVDKGTVGGMCAIQGREFATVWFARQPVLLKENATVRDVRGDVQVGHAYKGLNAAWDRAALWKGTPESYVDLHKLLPSRMKTSKAINIAEDGTIYGSGRDTKNHTVGIEWKPNPLYKPKKD
jgi:hypothetical protein